MTSAELRQARAAVYRVRACEAVALAAASALDHVREKHERAAVRWSELAAIDAPRVEELRLREAKKGAFEP